MEAGAAPQTYEEWVEEMGRKGRWIDGGCLEAAATELGRRVVVAHKAGSAETVYSFGPRKGARL
eukprot:2659712-Alexandrium_andersonii.AAC.1